MSPTYGRARPSAAHTCARGGTNEPSPTGSCERSHCQFRAFLVSRSSRLSIGSRRGGFCERDGLTSLAAVRARRRCWRPGAELQFWIAAASDERRHAVPCPGPGRAGQGALATPGSPGRHDSSRKATSRGLAHRDRVLAPGFGAKRSWLVLLYGIIGLGSLAKGLAGFVPLAIVLGDTIIAHGGVGLKRLVSIPGWVVLAGLAVPWWVVNAASAGHKRFVSGFVFNDQLLSYFGRDAWRSQTIAEPVTFAVTVLLPWGLLLPFAVRRALRETDPDAVRRVRLLLVWLATVFVLMAVSGKQRERDYLPLCPAAALLIGWWYSTLAWRGRARAFAGAWIAVVVTGAVFVKLDTPHFNATTDLRAVRAVLSQARAPLFSYDLQDLALSFNLNRAVVNAKNLQRFEVRVRQGEMGYLIVSDRALRTQPGDPCMRRIARGLV